MKALFGALSLGIALGSTAQIVTVESVTPVKLDFKADCAVISSDGRSAATQPY